MKLEVYSPNNVPERLYYQLELPSDWQNLNRVPQISPKFSDIKLFLTDSLADIVLHEFTTIAFDKVKSPGVKSDIFV